MVNSVRIAVAAGLLAAVTEPAAAFHPVGGALLRAPGTFFKFSHGQGRRYGTDETVFANECMI
jgi:hypothetical protein